MSSSTASAEVVPTNEPATGQGLKDGSSLRRIPTIEEVPLPSQDVSRGEVVVYSGVSFGASRRGDTVSTPSGSSQRSIENLKLFTDQEHPGQVFARVLILEEGKSVPTEALVTPLIAVSNQDRHNLDCEYSLNQLVESANVEITRFFDGFGPIDSEVKMKEFSESIDQQESLSFLLSNLLHENRGLGFDLFSAYFAPGGAGSGVGVFVNTWL